MRVSRDGTTRRVLKPHFKLAVGDRISLVASGQLRVVEVLGLPARRGPAPEARECYQSVVEEESESAARRPAPVRPKSLQPKPVRHGRHPDAARSLRDRRPPRTRGRDEFGG